MTPAPSRPVDPLPASAPRRPVRRRSWTELVEVRWAALSTVFFVVAVIAQVAATPAPLWWGLYLACYAAGGWEPAAAGVRALRDGVLDVDVLMVVAAVLAASIGQVFDGGLLVVIFATSGALEAYATRRTEDSVRALLDLAPDRATRVTRDGTEQVVDAADLVVGDHVLVRPGERVGADGMVLRGRSDIDQATITGEPLPVAKGPGEEVLASTVNGSGALTIVVTRAAGDTVVARIVAMVREASETKATTQLFVERIEQRYSVAVVAVTVALFALPLLAGADLEPTLLRAMTFMIVASPCAVVLATMPPLLAAIANAGRHGVLVKSAVALESLGQVGRFAFDKTGTLTQGRARVASVHAVTARGADDLLGLAAGAERRSEHPLARALVGEAAARGLVLDEPREFRSTPGRGVRAEIRGLVVVVGVPDLLDEVEPGDLVTAAAARAWVAAGEGVGHTVVVVLVDGAVAGVIALTDTVRDGAASTVTALAALTVAPAVLMSGDNPQAAGRLAAQVGIEDVRAGLLPEDKAGAVAALEAETRAAHPGRGLAFVGDGVNDAPAMATATVGVAMGRTGSDLALETADVVLVGDDLRALPAAVVLAQRARRVVRANLVIAGAVIAVLATWDVVGTLPLPLGVAGHEGSTILVALNGLRLLRGSAWRSSLSDQAA